MRPGGRGVAMPNVAKTAPTSYPQTQFVQVVRSQELPIVRAHRGVVLPNTPLKGLDGNGLRRSRLRGR
jgi:hypothetical protein